MVKKKVEETKYSKKQILKSKRYKGVQKDILHVVLDDDEKYSLQEVESLMNSFNAKEVK
jgi:hypothetical protein